MNVSAYVIYTTRIIFKMFTFMKNYTLLYGVKSLSVSYIYISIYIVKIIHHFSPLVNITLCEK